MASKMGRREMIAWIEGAQKQLLVQKVLIFVMVIAAIASVGFAFRTKQVMAAEIETLETENNELALENLNLSGEVEIISEVIEENQNTIQQKDEQIEAVSEAANQYAQIAYDIQDQNEMLAAANQELLEQQQELEAKYNDIANSSRLLKEYGYALYDSEGKRNDIGIEQLILVEELCSNAGISPHVSLGIIMAESEGHAKCANPKSTARGAAQFLKGTGSFVWTSLLGGSGYDHNTTPMNINNAIRMQVAYLTYLRNQTGSMYRAVQRYRGKTNINGYLNRMNSFMGKYGYNIHNYL